MKNLSDLAAVLTIASAAIMAVCAVYMARFEYRLMSKIRAEFVTKLENTLQEAWAKQEHARLDSEFGKVWLELKGKADK